MSNKNPEWYKQAVIYEVHVRAFFDSDGDGVGDFKGLTQKLDYLQDLGVTALWLLPFYPSPLRDDGYDIADCFSINPTYGDMRDFRTFLKEAHRRGLNVITELVLNHTSDQHPWFQRARRAPKGSRWRNFYVWSDNQEQYSGTRVIFQDFEPSNWSWDSLAGQYYWHRFYHHQPDLNFDNPEVRRTMLKVLDFWFGMGVDGLRLDAVPYLYEREGTNNENLPETHDFLRSLREHVDQRFPGRLLLAEANQWPDDAIAYFGAGDECHMAFHFPLMPRLFMAVRMEDRFPIIEILEQTPAIPDSCQWALFLRNHDELTLEMVTDEERDYMYRVYASDPQARINLGIRRRLSPLLGNNRRKIELMNGLLFSLPGTPILYYGDEIGMGDNVYLGDRNGVRTPMQWSGDRNAGFSRANPQQLYFPVIIDPEYHYETVNVETERGNLHSLLWWMKRLISLRKKYPVFGLGSIKFLLPQNRKIMAFVRKHQEQAVLVVANLSRYVQPVSLDLSEFEGSVPIELFGQTRFPHIGKSSYFMTLGPHSFYWFNLENQRADNSSQVISHEHQIPELEVSGAWDAILEPQHRDILESTLAGWLPAKRWFTGKSKVVQRIRLIEAVPLNSDRFEWRILLVQAEFTEGEPEIYQLPVAFVAEGVNFDMQRIGCIIARLKTNRKSEEQSGVLIEAVDDPNYALFLLDAIRQHRQFHGINGEVEAASFKSLKLSHLLGRINLEPRQLKAEQSNSSISFGDKVILKLFRRVEQGTNPEIEIGRFLTERRAYPNTPKLLGALEYGGQGDNTTALGVLFEYIPNEGDAAHYTIDHLGNYFENVLARRESVLPHTETRSCMELTRTEAPELARETIGVYLESARIIGRRIAELHLSLTGAEDSAFSPEPFSELYQRSMAHGMLALSNQVFQSLRSTTSLDAESTVLAERVLRKEPLVEERFKLFREHRIQAMRLRCHGDCHLGQLLCRGNDFIIIDFEGEPTRSIGERRIKRSPLKDVAGMLRSFNYAWEIAIRRLPEPALRSGGRGLEQAVQWGKFWQSWVSAAFLREYLEVAGPGEFLPAERDQLETLLNALLLERALYEVGYELNTRSDWVGIPIRGLLDLMGDAG
jgi:maltose alpha-D-glucosyltransferase / alpha-amylase